MNLVVLKGRLTKDVELRYSQSAEPKPYTNFSLAVNRFKDGVDFINCMAWNKTAEVLQKHCKKGQEILVTGRIQVEHNEVDGEKKTFTKIIVEKIEFCGSKGETPSSNLATGLSPIEEEDDLPF